jgi:ketosteroid isomerase-like protein
VSQQNVELTWQAVRSFNEGGLDALLEYLDADVEWLPPRESMEPGIYRGHDGVRDYLGRLAAIFGDGRVEPLEVIDVDDDRVIAVIRSIVRSEHSSVDITADWAWLITSANGRGVRVEIFTDKSQALKAVGLED